MEGEENKDYLMEKKIELLIDMKVSKLKSELAQAQEKIKNVTEELDVLKNKVQRINMGVEPQTTLTNDQTAPAGKKEVKKEESNGRTGNYSSEDVSVEKMFYYGNK